MKRILVPTDFSFPSQESLLFALELASLINGEVHVIHMIRMPVMPETTFGIQPFPFDEAMLKEQEKKAHAAYHKILPAGSTRVPVHFSCLTTDLITGIQNFCDEKKIDLVILSTHGASGMKEFFIGSTAEKIIRYTTVPVLALPGYRPLEAIRHMVFPNTLEPGQEELVNQVTQWQTLLHATLHVVLINTPSSFYTTRQAEDRLDAFAAHYKLHNYTLNQRNHQHERSGIIAFQQEIQGDLIAMGTHGRTGLTRFIYGSIAESVLNHANCGIWSFRIPF